MYPMTAAELTEGWRPTIESVHLHPDHLGAAPTWTIGTDGAIVGTIDDADDTAYLVCLDGRGCSLGIGSTILVVGSTAAKTRWWLRRESRASLGIS